MLFKIVNLLLGLWLIFLAGVVIFTPQITNDDKGAALIIGLLFWAGVYFTAMALVASRDGPFYHDEDFTFLIWPLVFIFVTVLVLVAVVAEVAHRTRKLVLGSEIHLTKRTS